MESESVQQFQQKEKKEWGRPILMIVVRGKPEESILTACKCAGCAGPAGGVVHL